MGYRDGRKLVTAEGSRGVTVAQLKASGVMCIGVCLHMLLHTVGQSEPKKEGHFVGV